MRPHFNIWTLKSHKPKVFWIMAGQERHLSNTQRPKHSTELVLPLLSSSKSRRTGHSAHPCFFPEWSPPHPPKLPGKFLPASSFRTAFSHHPEHVNHQELLRDQEATTQITATAFLHSVTLHLLFLTFQVIRGTVFWLCTLSKGGLWFMRTTQKLQQELPLHNRVLNPRSSHFCS